MSSTVGQPAGAATAASTHPFTCNACQVAFRSSELQRAHMQTDWHRYNLKRRVASLPPLSSEIFAEKVLANRASAAATAAKASFEKTCQACQKTYYSENAFHNHLGSQKHRQNALSKQKSAGQTVDDETASVMSSTFSLGEPIRPSDKEADIQAEAEFSEVVNGIKNASLEEPDLLSRRPSRPHHSSTENRPEHPLSRTDTETLSTENGSAPKALERPPGPLLTCLFCNFASPTFPLNILHMERHHGMFIPEKDYLVNSEGLIDHLYSKIYDHHACLYCGKAVHTASGIQTHMRDRGHCMIAFSSEEEMLEIGEFYDFTSTYSDDEADEMASEGGVKLDGVGAISEDEGWETDSTISDVPTDEITSVPIDDRSHRYKLLSRHRHHSHGDPRPHRAADGFHSHAHPTPHAVYHDEYELHLPSGRTAGHRSLNRYFRQNLRNYPSAEERAEQRAITAGSSADENDDDDQQQPGHDRGRQVISRANGGMGMVGVTEAKKKEIRATEKREKKREERERARYAWGNEKRGNFQKHFRDPLLQ